MFPFCLELRWAFGTYTCEAPWDRSFLVCTTPIGISACCQNAAGLEWAASMSRSSLQQFEAVAYSDGQDGIAGTEDDFEIGTIQAKWEIGNYYYTYFADDKQFVGTIDQTGLFTPSLETSNQKRPETLNNAGSVWVVASYIPPDPKQSLQGRAYLLVAAPIYVKHDMP